MADMREALFKAGLVSKNQVKAAEEQKSKQEEVKSAKLEKRIHDRAFAREWGGWFGDKRPQFYFWMRDGKVPSDADRRCGICGKSGRVFFDAISKVMTAMKPKPGDSLYDVSDRGFDAALNEKESILWPTTQLDFYPDLKKVWPFENEPLKMCGKCREETLKPFMR